MSGRDDLLGGFARDVKVRVLLIKKCMKSVVFEEVSVFAASTENVLGAHSEISQDQGRNFKGSSHVHRT